MSCSPHGFTKNKTYLEAVLFWTQIFLFIDYQIFLASKSKLKAISCKKVISSEQISCMKKIIFLSEILVQRKRSFSQVFFVKNEQNFSEIYPGPYFWIDMSFLKFIACTKIIAYGKTWVFFCYKMNTLFRTYYPGPYFILRLSAKTRFL